MHATPTVTIPMRRLSRADGTRRAEVASTAAPASSSSASMSTTSTPNSSATSCFADIGEATQFVFELDGSCGYHWGQDRLSFQKIQYPQWDLQFCHKYEYDFSLLNYLFGKYDLYPQFDCVLFMEKVPQVWGASWLYTPDGTPEARTVQAQTT